jgi:SHS2 domain-containing protein
VYELFDHTADIGLRVVADDLDGLFRDAADGFFSLIVEEIPDREPVERLHFEVEAERDEHLLVDWLNELLYVFDSRGLLLDRFEVSVANGKLEADAVGRPLDAARDRVLREVKAVTYHGLRLERTERGWLAEVILDI